MKIRILSAASRDLLLGERFYEQQQEGLGTYFLDCLATDIDSLLFYAGIHRSINGYHCVLSKRFPYAIYYKIASDEVRISRILDCRQHPAKTNKVLK